MENLGVPSFDGESSTSPDTANPYDERHRNSSGTRVSNIGATGPLNSPDSGDDLVLRGWSNDPHPPPSNAAASPQNYRDNERDSFHLNISYDASEESNNDMVANNLDLSFRSTAKPGDDDDVVDDDCKDHAVVHASVNHDYDVHVNGNANNPNDNNPNDFLDQYAHTEFPTVEVTVDSSSCMSASDYEQDGSDFERLALQPVPISPLTPSIAERNQASANNTMNMNMNMNNTYGNENGNNGNGNKQKSKKQSEADHLMNVLRRVSSKSSNDYNDIDMGNTGSINHDRQGMRSNTRTRSRNTPNRRNSKHPAFKMQRSHLDNRNDYDSEASYSTDTAPTRNQRSHGDNYNHGHRRYNYNASHNNNYTNSNTDRQMNKNGGMHSPSTSLASSYQQQYRYQEFPQPPFLQKKKHRADPTLHAQTFVLSLAFFAIWSPQNLMAPNLTQMAQYFDFTSEQRDLYLGANIAFATGVLSLPVQTLLGFLADVVPNRKKLFAYTVMMGGVASVLTGYSETYTQLYFCRFLCGGCMSGSVPIAFSMLGDLFEPKDRNAASSGLTAMMGAGILLGQVGAGVVGDKVGWKRPFHISGMLSIVTSLMVLYFVREPVRGGKEKVLQEMIANGTKYDRKLTTEGFMHAMTQNKTNVILMLQSFSTSVPWGIIFTFLNDYFTQEQGMSVPASTILILWFGFGCAAGGIIGGYIGTKVLKVNRALLPLFMSFSTVLGIAPFLGLLDLKLSGGSLLAIFLAFTAPCIANLPSVNVRPCILNVNPPETRGAAMTAANMMVNVARGFGPSLVTLSQRYLGASRQYSFNLSLIVFWSITAVLLLILARTLPHDQDAMDAELESYAASKISDESKNKRNGLASNAPAHAKLNANAPRLSLEELEDGSEAGRTSLNYDDMTLAGEESIVSIEERMTSFDASALQESWTFIGGALREIAEASHIIDYPDSDIIPEHEEEDSTGRESIETDRLIEDTRT